MYIGNKQGETKMNNEIKELIEYKELDITDYADAWELYDALDYDGSVHELVDGMIDIYYVDLRKWSVDNYSYVEDAISEGLCEGVEDFHKLIQLGQYVYYKELANESIEEVYKELTEEVEQTA
jgi:hypothetical protein